jgi:hypothetical protein
MSTAGLDQPTDLVLVGAGERLYDMAGDDKEGIVYDVGIYHQ